MAALQQFTDDQLRSAMAQAGNVCEKAAKILGVCPSAVSIRKRKLEGQGESFPRAGRLTPRPPEFSVPEIPDDDVPIGELIAQRKRKFEKRRDYEEAVKLIPVTVKIKGAIGILHYGDPHVDDDGTDIGALEEHAAIVRSTPGLFAATVGDMTNNWIGRLARLYAEQSTSAKQAWRICEWFVEQNRGHWLYLVGGNHDGWSGAGDPLQWITRQNDALYRASECRMQLNFPGGRAVRVNCRHDFQGHSQWNPAHGPMKALALGVRDHLATCGHKHESAYSVLKDPTEGITMHALKIASYKVYDRYAKEKGFRDQTLSPCAVTTINPALPDDHPDMVKVWWDPREGADFLTYLRGRK